MCAGARGPIAQLLIPCLFVCKLRIARIDRRLGVDEGSARARGEREDVMGDPARRLLAEADELLKTSVWRWTPDYIQAGATFDKAGASLRASGQSDAACRAYERAVDCHLKGSGWESAVRSLAEAGKSLPARSADLARREAKLCLENGAKDRAADALARASAALEAGGDAATGLDLLCEAADLVDPDPDSGRNLVRGLEILRGLINRLVKAGRLPEAVRTATKLRTALVNAKQTSSMYKVILTLIILHLARGDVAAAQIQLNDAFQDSAFLRTDECAAAEDIVKAWLAMDAETVKKIGASRTCTNLEREVGYLARQLDPLRRVGGKAAQVGGEVTGQTRTGTSAPPAAAASAAPAAAPAAEVPLDEDDLPDLR